VPGKGPPYRDISMAENLDWFRQTHPDEKVVLWAHNTHVQFGVGSDNIRSMGAELREIHGKEMYVVGFAFRKGSVRAVGIDDEQLLDLTVCNVPPSDESSGDGILSAAGVPLFFLDMSSLPEGTPLAGWLASPHPFHNFEANWTVDNADANMDLEGLSTLY